MPSDYATGFGHVTILTLDDDATMRAAVGSTLRAAGCRNVIQVGNGPDALEIIAGRSVDLVLCDCQMAPMDGLAFLERLRITRAGAGMPVIMLTASSDEEEAWRARELKVAAWLVKPVTPATLAAQVAAALGMAAPHVAADALASLASAYEARLPEEIGRLARMAREVQAGTLGAAPGLEELIRALHTVKGQAGTLGYPLLGRIAGWLHDMVRRLLRHPAATAPLLAEAIKVLHVGAGTMSLVAERKLRGEGGEAGARILAQLGGVVSALCGRLDEAVLAEERAQRDRRDRAADRRAEAEADRWLLERRINLDTLTGRAGA
jgi:two-component system chemotaxis response regulator CheY